MFIWRVKKSANVSKSRRKFRLKTENSSMQTILVNYLNNYIMRILQRREIIIWCIPHASLTSSSSSEYLWTFLLTIATCYCYIYYSAIKDLPRYMIKGSIRRGRHFCCLCVPIYCYNIILFSITIVENKTVMLLYAYK